MTKINNKKIFALAFRTAIVLVITFYAYEYFVNLEKNMDKNKYYNAFVYEIIKHFTYFICAFTADLFVLYLIVTLFHVKL
jgi:hypothetical protein